MKKLTRKSTLKTKQNRTPIVGKKPRAGKNQNSAFDGGGVSEKGDGRGDGDSPVRTKKNKKK